MDNRQVDVVSVGREHLKAALGILFANAAGGKATHYLDAPAAEERPRTLVFFWHQEGQANALPVPLDLEGATDLAARWLEALPAGEKPGRLDMDGDCVPEAFRVFCEQWGHVLGHHYAFAGIQGRHAWYGK